MSRRVPGFDRFMVANSIGRETLLRRQFTVPERWCWVAGVLATAAESPVRGWLFVTEKLPAQPEDVAETAGVSPRVALSTLAKCREFSLIEWDEIVGADCVTDFDLFNPSPRSDTTNAKRQKDWNDRRKARIEELEEALANGHTEALVTRGREEKRKEGKRRTAISPSRSGASGRGARAA